MLIIIEFDNNLIYSKMLIFFGKTLNFLMGHSNFNYINDGYVLNTVFLL